MVAPVYSTDLVTVNLLDTTTPAVGEPTGSTSGTTIAVETDHFVVGTACIAKIFNATGVGGLGFQNASSVTVPTDGAVYMWTYFGAPSAIADQSAGGMQILVGDTLANYKRYYVYGKDKIPYGGWQVNAINPSQTASATQGSPNGTWQYFGMASNVLAAVARGYPLAWDAVRAGRGSLIAEGGDLGNGYATFLGMATKNDLNTTGDFNRWGILSFGLGTFTLQGRLALGSVSTAVDFRDSNRAIFIKNTEYVSSAFNLIEVINASSNISWTGISISSLGTVSRGNFLVTNNATISMSTCTFTDMGTFVLASNTVIDSTTFRRCQLVTLNGAVITNSTFENSAGAVAVLANISQISNLSNSELISDGTGHAIEITGTATNIGLTGVQFVGYAASNGSTGNEAIYVNIASGTVNITISGGSSPSIRTAGATVNVISGATVTFTGLPTGTDVVILTAGTTSILQQVDSNPTSSFAWGYSGTPTVDVGFIKQGFVPYYIRGLALGSTDSSIPVAMSADRNFI